MVGQTRGGRENHHRFDSQSGIQALIDGLGDNVTFEVDAPADPSGEYWIDIVFDGYTTNVAWRPDRGFGLFTSKESAFGERPDEIFREPQIAAKRLKQLAKRAPDDQAAMRLSDVRMLVDARQTSVAERLRKNQGFISRLERQNDALLSTVREYIEALGGAVRLVVQFDGFEAPVDLPQGKLDGRSLRRGPRLKVVAPGATSAGKRSSKAKVQTTRRGRKSRSQKAGAANRTRAREVLA